ncbi:MAG TPA: hypothetical protein VIR27_05200 [Mycobacteriales bacterium]
MDDEQLLVDHRATHHQTDATLIISKDQYPRIRVRHISRLSDDYGRIV